MARVRDTQDLFVGVAPVESCGELRHVVHGGGAPGALVLAHHKDAQVGQLGQKVQAGVHLHTYAPHFTDLCFLEMIAPPLAVAEMS